MIKRLDVFQTLSHSYLFPEINRRKELFLKEHPEVKLTNLGIGNTVLPLPKPVTEALIHAAAELGKVEGYSGYGMDQGDSQLRQKICETYYPHLDRKSVV